MNAVVTICTPHPPKGYRRISNLATDYSEKWVDCTCCGAAQTHEHDKCRTCNGWGVLVVGAPRL